MYSNHVLAVFSSKRCLLYFTSHIPGTWPKFRKRGCFPYMDIATNTLFHFLMHVVYMTCLFVSFRYSRDALTGAKILLENMRNMKTGSEVRLLNTGLVGSIFKRLLAVVLLLNCFWSSFFHNFTKGNQIYNFEFTFHYKIICALPW